MASPAPSHPFGTVAARAWLALALFAWLAWPAAARAETTACTVLDTFPATINAPGHYCLEADVSGAFVQPPVLILADDVVLDCNGHRLRHTALDSSTAGINSRNSHDRITVRNCLVDGFYYGISLEGYTGDGVRGSTISGNTIVRSRIYGIQVNGSDNLIEDNLVTEIRGDISGNPSGIVVNSFNNDGAGNVIRNNTITNIKPATTASSFTQGIVFFNLRNTTVEGNHVSGLFARAGNGSIAITGSGTSGAAITGNTILTVPYPAASPYDGNSYYGVYITGSAQEQATNVCRDNVVGHFNIPYYGCVQDATQGY